MLHKWSGLCSSDPTMNQHLGHRSQVCLGKWVSAAIIFVARRGKRMQAALLLSSVRDMSASSARSHCGSCQRMLLW